ncbi:Taf3p [Saccharomyces eubayanus]|uniref:Taf3p n=1 Tax=Saccharomyces eubayanus TaxID=1080349 RepID=UPI0006C4A269|nr:TAF3-like protein [Saccharomyces eubayanus]KOG96295.1 TAF3-like protein [Saccharomyces eubayanus]
MTTNHDFYFALLRISILQLLKAQGFDRARPSLVDVMTDLYTKFLNLLASEVSSIAQSRCDQDDTVALQDITLALENLGIVKPTDVLDVYDENPELSSSRGMEKFKEWCLSAQSSDARITALPTVELLQNEEKESNPLSAIPDYLNQLQQNKGVKQKLETKNKKTELIEDLINNNGLDDWIKLVVARQRINLIERASKKDSQNVMALPHIGGYKSSLLSHPHHSTINNEDRLPSTMTPRDEDALTEIRDNPLVTSKLPIMRTENRLENITLSFENEELEPFDETEDPNQTPHDDSDVDNSKGDNKSSAGSPHNDDHDISMFQFDPDVDTKWAEQEDMDSTFQRRTSLDYGGYF